MAGGSFWRVLGPLAVAAVMASGSQLSSLAASVHHSATSSPAQVNFIRLPAHSPTQIKRPVSTMPLRTDTVVATTASTSTTTVPASTTMVPASTTTVPPTTSTTEPTKAPTVLTASGGKLLLNGQPYRDVGLNAYELGTYWGIDAGCGAMLSDTQLNTFMASLAPHTLVRIAANEGGMAVNVHTGRIDWAPLDRIVAAAAAHGDLLIFDLSDQSGTCENMQWKTLNWYAGGYLDGAGMDAAGVALPLTYWQFVQAIVSRYATSPAVGMWEPVNEPDASSCPGFTPQNCAGHQTCPNESAAALALRSFFDAVGGEIHALDPVHPVESGLVGSGQCGTSGADFQFVAGSPGLDVLTVHDYYPADDSLGGDQWNGIAVRIAQAAAVGKPLIAGEVGVQAGTAPGCPSLSDREQDFSDRISRQAALGVQAFLFWNWEPAPSGDPCTFDLLAGDPSLALAHQF